MATMTAYKPGTFCWVDLSTSDQKGAKTFYSKLFGWEAEDIPVAENTTYSMMKKNGKSAAAISPQREKGTPTVWSSYVSVENVDAAAKKAKSLGGSVVMEPMDVMTEGRMAVVKDPTGAYISVWEPKKTAGAEIVNDPGAFVWNELLTTDVNKAQKFYGGLFDWKAESGDMPDGSNYTTLKNGDRPAGGLMAIRPEWGPMPPNWGVYFTVEDVDDSAARVRKLGGKVLAGPQDIPGTGRFATCQDPQGGTFSIIEMTTQP